MTGVLAVPHAAPGDVRLARFARERIAEELGGPAAGAPRDPGVLAPGACFVTLHRGDGRLHGCVGSLTPLRPLVDDVERNALAAAFHDPRADPIALDDVAALAVAVSVLSRLEPIDVRGEDAACAALRPGVHGVVLRWRGRRATLLPQVWTTLPDPADFLRALRQKLGVPDDAWHEDFELLRYTVETVRDHAPLACEDA